MNCDSFILFAGDPYAMLNALAFLLATLTGAAAEQIERALRRNSRFLFPTAIGAAAGLAAGIPLLESGWFCVGTFLFRALTGALGGFLGATVVKARKKRKNGDSSGGESEEKSVS